MKQYNKPLRFDGDIIITDPCYLMKRGEENQLVHILGFDLVQKPEYKNFFSGIPGPNKTLSDRDYADCVMLHLTDSRLTPVDISTAEIELGTRESLARLFEEKFSMEEAKENFLVPYSEIFRKENASYMAALSVYDETRDDWSYCQCGNWMERLGIRTYLCNSTHYGDWSCTTYNTDNKEIIVQFCADSGLVGIFLLDEVLKYNPDFDYHLNRKHTTTWIKDFHGTVELHIECNNNEPAKVNVVGKGSINFKSIQTGF